MLLAVVFCVSGAAGLLFETIWFRLAGLALGNGVYSSSLVLAAFMAGNALGTLLTLRWQDRIRRPGIWFAGAQMLIGLTGVGLVFVLPLTGSWFAPLFRSLEETPAFLHLVRSTLAFSLMLIPATAMGMTLPLATAAAVGSEAEGAGILGRLYGLNTLGAVVGALAGELWAFRVFGLTGTAMLAGSLNLLCGALIGVFGGQSSSAGEGEREPAEAAAVAAGTCVTAPAEAISLLALGILPALSGALLLALEVIWFRFLQLFIHGTSLAFAAMLAVVLLGIGLGGLAAGWWLRRSPETVRWVPALLFAAGTLVCFTYVSFPAEWAGKDVMEQDLRLVLLAAAVLMLPVCLISGALFPLLGEFSRAVFPGRLAMSGFLSLANTCGAMIGPLVAGFLLLPRLGVEGSLFGLACGYLGAGILAVMVMRKRSPGLPVMGTLLAGALLVISLAGYPFGLFANYSVLIPARKFLAGQATSLVAVREGLTDTLILLQESLYGKPVTYRLMTNSFSMTGSNHCSRRYMRLFALLPQAFHPDPKKGLLICYGMGLTARAMTAFPGYQQIRIVDIAPEIPELSRLTTPGLGPSALDDPRVKLTIEDGRFFLQTSAEQFDVITAEPPPPKTMGVGSLYSREFFRLLRDRLAPGGYVTYWLPIYQLTRRDAQGIIAAFLESFPEASLWNGAAGEWILLGFKSPVAAVTRVGLERLWKTELLRDLLDDIGVEKPVQLITPFMAGSEELRRLCGNTPALCDDYPLRLSPDPNPGYDPEFLGLMNPEAAAGQFRRSPVIDQLFDQDLRTEAAAAFSWERWRQLTPCKHCWDRPFLEVARILANTDFVRLPQIVMGIDPAALKALNDLPTGTPVDMQARFLRGVEALSRRQYASAAVLLPDLESGFAGLGREDVRRSIGLRVLALHFAGQTENARKTLHETRSRLGPEILEDRLVGDFDRWLSLNPSEHGSDASSIPVH